jgi:AcrR family transcriptional regulator
MKTRMKSDERRAAIVRYAARLFAEKGFRGTTTRELAAGLGVTEPVLYQHFRTKKDLYSAIIEAKCEGAEKAAKGFRELAASDDDDAFFSALGQLILSRFEKDPELLRILLYSSLERHGLSEMFFDRMVADFFRIVSGYIKRRIQAGAFRKVHPDVTSRGLIGMFHYHGLVGMLYPGKTGKPNRKKLVHELVTVFLHGISAEGQEG